MITSRALRSYNPTDRLYCTVMAAVLGAGALSAGATAWGASNAADAQRDAATASIANQKEMYGKNQANLQPFINAGAGGIPGLEDWLRTNSDNPLSQLIKLTTPGADMSATLEQTPGYQFSQKQGTRAAMNALAARGLGGSPGAIAKGVSSFNSGLASQTWDSVVKNLLATFQSGGNAMQGLVNTGLSGANALAGVGTNTANSISGAITGAGNASAASSNAIGGAIGGLGNSMTTAAMLQQLGSGGGGSIYGAAPTMGLGGLPAIY